DQRGAYDEMRERCPIAYSDSMKWSIFRHDDVVRVLEDHETFSNAVSQHFSVPNGMDPPEHTPYRRIIEKYFAADRMDAFEPVVRTIAEELLESLLSSGSRVDVMEDFAKPFAGRVQCAFLGWPDSLHEPLIRWAEKNHDATRDRDRRASSEIAREFEALVDDMIETRLEDGVRPEEDVTAELMQEKIGSRRLSNEEIASILRNWTVGEIGTISASVGILVHYLAEHEDLQAKLRRDPGLLLAAIDEILRLHGPLVANRRITTRPVNLAGQVLEAGERITIMWLAAHRDGRRFDEPNAFRFDRDPDDNLLYGAGIHVCPGAPLARMELRVVLEELLDETSEICLHPDARPVPAEYPASGFAAVPVRIN
ncbi:MAG: cytochrome P450, partial [Rhodothermales bacterium]